MTNEDQPAYADTPEKLRTELNKLRITTDPLKDESVLNLPRGVLNQMEDLVEGSKRGSQGTIRRLRKLLSQYPECRTFKNLLSVGLARSGRVKESRAMHEEIYRDHPDYLFAKVNMAATSLDGPDAIKLVPKFLGPTLRLSDAEPRGIYHLSEVKSFYVIVAEFHLLNNRPDLAHTICEFLEKHVHNESVIEDLRFKIAFHNLNLLKSRMESDRAKAICVKVHRRKSASPTTFPPELHHPEVGELLGTTYNLPEELICRILALPRQTLIEDLESILEATLSYDNHLSDYEGDPPFFPGHAIRFLGELKAETAIPIVLELLSQNEEFLSFWFDDDLTSLLWEPLYHLMEGQLEHGFSWMTSPGISSEGRIALADVVAWIAVHRPERREEVINWFRRVLEFFRDSPPEDNVLDTKLATLMVENAMDIGASELMPVIGSLFERGYIQESFVGNLKEVADKIVKPYNRWQGRRLVPLIERFREMNHWDEDPEDDSFDLSPAPTPPRPLKNRPASQLFHPDFKVGRNDPCPCGSGLKFKKCCLR
ncbi:MAG: hypothetical protein Fur0032_12870 [Terrimicrobiaceae bacterium]